MVHTFGTNKPENIEANIVELGIRLQSGFTMQLKASVVPKITGKIERRPIETDIRERLKTFDLADTIPTVTENTYIDLLVGNDYYADIVSMQRMTVTKGLYLLQSKLGWVLSGRTQKQAGERQRTVSMLTYSSNRWVSDLTTFSCVDENLELKPRLEELWKLETIGIKDCPFESDDERALIKFNESIKYENKRYWLGWPYRSDNPDLPDNYRLAYGCLKSNLKRLKENPKLLKDYNNIIKEQLEKGILEKVNESKRIGEIIHYLPHHAVVTPRKTTTKVRIVCNGSAKSIKGNLSLNECLFRGPVMLEDLVGIIMRFRTHTIAIVADSEKAYLQVGLRHEDRDAVRILWVKDITKGLSEDNLVILRFTRVLFGIISSGFMLAATVKHHLTKVGTENAQLTIKDTYVDNTATGKEKVSEAVIYYKETKKIFQDMSMNVREWGSNSDEFMESLPKEDKISSKTV